MKQIITEQPISDQVKLLAELQKHNINTTQATISRDLQEMGVVKIRVEPGVFKYEFTEKIPPGLLTSRLQVSFENFVTEVNGVNNMLLVKTTPGNANGLASLIDSLKKPEILGTIAGDDTILMVISSDKACGVLQAEFRGLLESQ
ncbi:MAG: arginine repressor [Planctomycetes bacterium]|nr:arginine repressor [Planctomycetota bacterium]